MTLMKWMKERHSFSVLYTFLLWWSASILVKHSAHAAMKDPDDPPPVIIRLDDVTAGWCEEQSVACIEACLELDTPINVGLIGAGLDQSPLLREFLFEIAENPLIEMASHSYWHESFDKKSIPYQEDDLRLVNDMSNKLTGKIPMTFIPPLNEFDVNTVFALNNNSDYSIFSPQCSWFQNLDYVRSCPNITNITLDVVAPDIYSPVHELYVLPTGAVLGDAAYWNNYLLPGSVEDATVWIETQIANQGFAVLMLHPVEFATDQSCSVIDDVKIKVLQDLIKSNTLTGQPGGKWKFLRFQDAVEYLTGDVVVQAEREYMGPPKHIPPTLPYLIVFGSILAFMLLTCCCSYYTPEINKCKKTFCCCCGV